MAATTYSISIPSGMIINAESQSFLVTCGRLFSSENSREKLAAFSVKHFTDGMELLNASNPQLQELGRLSNTFWQAFSVLEFPRHSMETLSHFYSLLRREGENALDFFRSSALSCGTFCIAQDFLARYHFIEPIFSDTKSLLLWRVFQGVDSCFGFIKSFSNLVGLWKETNKPVNEAGDDTQDGVVGLKSISMLTRGYKLFHVLFEISAQICCIAIGVLVALGASIGFAVNTMAIFHLNTALIITSVFRNFLEQKVKEAGITMSKDNSDFIKTLYIHVDKK